MFFLFFCRAQAVSASFLQYQERVTTTRTSSSTTASTPAGIMNTGLRHGTATASTTSITTMQLLLDRQQEQHHDDDDGYFQQDKKNDRNKKEQEEESLEQESKVSSSLSSSILVTRCMTAGVGGKKNVAGTSEIVHRDQLQTQKRQHFKNKSVDNQALEEIEPCASSTTNSSNDIISTSNTTTTTSNDSFIIWSPQEIQSRSDAEKELYNYLYKNIMSFDVPNAQSLGFHNGDDPNDENLPDGLSDGIVAHTISLSLDARQIYPWTFHIPKKIYFEYVGGFANVNESRNNWRPLFKDVVDDLLQPMWWPFQHGQDEATVHSSVEDVVKHINEKLWDQFHTKTGKPIYFQSGQTPLIYDPMSIISFGYASCTGLSIFLIDALRTAGIPARLAGTPAWNGKKENGNHSWVEFYGSDSQWHIMEAKPASGGGSKEVDLWDPCQWWFCNPGRTEHTNFYAARLDRSDATVVFPLAWDSKNDGVMGEDRTDFMRDLCSQC